MKGHIKKRGDRYYAVIYEGRDPVTGKELRRWHPAGTDRADAERLATKLAAQESKRTEAVRSLTFGAYLTSQWLPAKQLHLATSTYRGYERNVQRHVLPTLGRVSIRRLRYQQIESLYDTLLHPDEGKGLAPKTVYEIHLIVKGALADALRRGLVTRNVAVVARAPKQRSLQRTEGTSLTEDELRQLMRAAVGHRLFPFGRARHKLARRWRLGTPTSWSGARSRPSRRRRGRRWGTRTACRRRGRARRGSG